MTTNITPLQVQQRRADVIAEQLLTLAGEYHAACSDPDSDVVHTLARLERLQTASQMLFLAGYDLERRENSGPDGVTTLAHVGAYGWSNMALDLASRHLTDVGNGYPVAGAEYLTPSEQRATLAARLVARRVG